jgi:outer membrane protein OmpA-like peptidoglycan-associated protein
VVAPSDVSEQRPGGASDERKDLLRVSLVPVPGSSRVWPEVCQSRTDTYDQNSALEFQGQSAQFRSRDAARAELADLAAWLADNPARTLHIEGRTANYGAAGEQLKTATARAEATKALLVELGARAEQITTEGVGSQFDGYEPDRDANGHLIEEVARRNRNVQLTATEICS